MIRTFDSDLDENINKYFRWLCRKVRVDLNAKPTQSYYLLMRELFRKEFYWTVSLDANRAEDGLYLRNSYDEYIDLGPCRVLEMLIALSLRCEDILTDMELDSTSHWFWEMIENLGLEIYTDDKIDRDSIEFILDRWLDRDYSWEGRGNIFYIENSDFDLSKIEIWNQLQLYTTKKYLDDFDDFDDEF